MKSGPTIAACASAVPAHSALLRVSGDRCSEIIAAVGLPQPAPWTTIDCEWVVALGSTPCRILWAPAGKSFTGFDQAEIIIPGAPDLVASALTALHAAGAEPAAPGGFTRQALASGRLTLDQAEAVLAVAQAADAESARSALQRLQGGLSAELEPVRQRLIALRALVEAGLDFIDEEDVRAYEPVALRVEIIELQAVIQRWVRAAGSLGVVPDVCLAGPANAGKSALFQALTGHEALVSSTAGTTRDWLDATWTIADRDVRLIDTAGLLDAALRGDLDDQAIAAGQERLNAAALVLWCSAPDAPLPTQLPAVQAKQLVIATKADLGGAEHRAVLGVSATSGDGLAALTGLVARSLAEVGDGDPRQQRLLAAAINHLEHLQRTDLDDVLIADTLAAATQALDDLLGVTTPDDVLGAIFSKFCIGK